MIYKRFEKWDLEPTDFQVEAYRIKEEGMRTPTRGGVAIELLPYNISVSCHSQRSQIKNRDECFNMLEVILRNYELK